MSENEFYYKRSQTLQRTIYNFLEKWKGYKLNLCFHVHVIYLFEPKNPNLPHSKYESDNKNPLSFTFWTCKTSSYFLEFSFIQVFICILLSFVCVLKDDGTKCLLFNSTQRIENEKKQKTFLVVFLLKVIIKQT